MPGALVIERNVLEWRCDPTSDARLPEAVGDGVEWVIVCSEGYTSSLAAAALLDIGLPRATDAIGGYHALAAAGVLAELAELAGDSIEPRVGALVDDGCGPGKITADVNRPVPPELAALDDLNLRVVPIDRHRCRAGEWGLRH